MPIDAPYEPSPTDYVAAQVATYEDTGGREGGEMQGAPCVILTTVGRASGNARKSPLIRVEHDGGYAVIASKGGAPDHPLWYLNLEADPHVTLQDRDVVRDFRARTATGEERERWWQVAIAAWPDYTTYQTKTDREIPVVVLDPMD